MTPEQCLLLIPVMDQKWEETLVELPDVALDAIAAQSVGQDVRAWCRLATTCKRLWTLQLPSSLHGHTIHINPDRDETSAMMYQRA